MRTDIAQTHVPVTPGQPTRVEIDVTNTSDVIDGVTAIVDGINPDWVRLERPLISIFPEASDRLAVIFDVPRTCPAGDYLVVVRVVSTIDADRDSVHDFWLSVGLVESLDVELRPSIVTGGATGSFDTVVRNTGNAAADVSIAVLEPTRAVDCRAEPSRIVLGHGSEAVLPVTLRGPRPWIGQPVTRQIHVGVSSGTTVVEKVATFHQKPRIPRGLITALMLAGIVALWALIFLWVISEMRSGAEPAKATGTEFMTGPANVPIAAVAGEARGTVTAATTGKGIPRITVEAWRVKADGTQVSVGSAATDDEGLFVLPSLLPGDYRLRLTADGFVETWYTADGGGTAGEVVRVEPLATVDGLDVVLGGETGSLTGKLNLPPGSEGTPLTVTATLVTETSGSAAGEAAPQSFSQVTSDGTVNLTGLPTPGTYQVTVTGPGFETQSFQQVVGGGQAAVLDTLAMGAATGSIEGTVVDSAGQPLGGVRVVARSGDTEMEAVTPTAGSVGTFRLIGLETPATYVITFTRDDYSSQTVALSLSAGATQTVSARLVGGSATIVGQAIDARGEPLGGITVEVVGGEFTGKTATLTTSGPDGAAGSFSISGLDPTEAYTVTLSGPNLQTETLPAVFGAAGTQDIGQVTLLPQNGTVTGRVSSGGAGVGEVAVTLTDGDRNFVTTSATNPAGTFAFADVPTGAYTLTFARTGYATRVVLVVVGPGGAVERDVEIAAAG